MGSEMCIRDSFFNEVFDNETFVSIKLNIVAMLGSIIPEPLEIPVICELTPLNLKFLVIPFGKVSVVIIALAEFNQSLFGNFLCETAERIFLIGYGSPITPVEHTKNLLEYLVGYSGYAVGADLVCTGPDTFTARIDGPANLWSLQYLSSKGSSLLPSYEAFLIDAIFRRGNRVTTVKSSWSKT